jgi:hypothetical protein
MALNHERRNRQQRRYEARCNEIAVAAHLHALNVTEFGNRLRRLHPKRKPGKKQTLAEFFAAGGKVTKV